MGERRICLECGAHAFDRWCSVCGSERLEPLGPRFEAPSEQVRDALQRSSTTAPLAGTPERRAV